MDGDGKKPLKIANLEFHKLNLNKGKKYPVKNLLPGLKSKDGLKSLNSLEIAIKNLDTEPKKQLILIWMIQQKERSFEALKWIV